MFFAPLMIFKLLRFGRVLSVLLFKLLATLLAAISWSLFLLLVIFLILLLFKRLFLVSDRFFVVVLRFGTIVPFVFGNVRRDILFVVLVSFIRILLDFLLLNGFLVFKSREVTSVLLMSFQVLIALEPLLASLAFTAKTVLGLFFVRH